MWPFSPILFVFLWAFVLCGPVPPSVDTSPAAENLAVRVSRPPSTKGEGVSPPKRRPNQTQTAHSSDQGRPFRNIAFLSPAPDVSVQRAPSPVSHRDSLGKMRQQSVDVPFSHAIVPNYFVMNPPYSKVALGLESNSEKTGKSQATPNETGNELNSTKLTNLTLREQHLIWKKEMLEKKAEVVDTKVYQVQNNIIVHSHNASEKVHPPYKMNATKSGNKAQINIDNSTGVEPLVVQKEKSPDKSPEKSPDKSPGKSPEKSPGKSPEKSLLITNPKITNRRLLVNNSGLDPNEISLRPNEIRVSVTLRDKDGRKIVVPAIYTPKRSAPPPLTNTEDLALVPVDQDVDVKDILTTTTSVPDVITTEKITTISERIESLLSTTRNSLSTGTVTSSRIPVTPIPSRILPQSTDSLVVKSGGVPLSTPMPRMEATTASTTAQPMSTTSKKGSLSTPQLTMEAKTTPIIPQLVSTINVLRQSVTSPISAVASETTGRPLLQDTPEPIQHSTVALHPDITKFGQSNYHQTGPTTPNPMPSDDQSVSLPMDTYVLQSPASVESILLSSEKAFNESKRISQLSNSTEVPPFLKDIITTIDDRLAELIRETVSRYVQNSENSATDPTGAVDAIPQQTSQININLDDVDTGTTNAPTKTTAKPVSLLRQSLDAALTGSTAKPVSLLRQSFDAALAGSTAKPISLLRQSLDAALAGSTAKPISLLRQSLDAALAGSTAKPRSLLRQSLDAALAGSTAKPRSLLRQSLDAALADSTVKAPPKSGAEQKQLIGIDLDREVSYPKRRTTTRRPRFGRRRLNSGILGLTQIEPVLEKLTSEISNGADRVRKELSYLAEGSADNLVKNVEEASDRVAEITATSYRGALQTRDAMNRLLGRAVENLGNFVSNAVQDTVKTAFGTAQSVGQFIHDLNVNAMDGILNRGNAVRSLFSNTINDMSEATNRTVTVLSRVMEKNSRTLLDK